MHGASTAEILRRAPYGCVPGCCHTRRNFDESADLYDCCARSARPAFLYPFLNTTSKTRPFEYLRLTSLGVIGALVKVTDHYLVMCCICCV